VIGLLMMVPAWLSAWGRVWQRTDGHPPHPDAKWGSLATSSIPAVRRRK
jgi:hypothetical protein